MTQQTSKEFIESDCINKSQIINDLESLLKNTDRSIIEQTVRDYFKQIKTSKNIGVRIVNNHVFVIYSDFTKSDVVLIFSLK